MTGLRRVLLGLMAVLVFGVATGQNPEPTPLPVGSAAIAEMKGEQDAAFDSIDLALGGEHSAALRTQNIARRGMESHVAF